MTSSSHGGVWPLGTAALLIVFVGDPFGNVVNAVALVLVVIAALQVLTTKPASATTNTVILALAAMMLAIATLQILHPNVPSLTIGILGFRKSAMVLLGVIIGVGWRGSRVYGLRLAWWCLFGAASLSLVVHLAFPSIEQSISRSADKYTSLLGGVERMQGLFAGPFHVSMVGVFLVLSASVSTGLVHRRSVRYAAVAVGLSCIYFSQVRTGLVALGLGLIVMLLITGTAQQWAGRMFLFCGLALLGIAFVKPLTEYANQFTALRLILDGGLDDSRFTTRFDSWASGLDMVDRSPLFGNGSGSAGDTLGSYFAAGDHVTSHNTLLKYAVEGGLIQAMLFLLLCIAIAFAHVSF